MAGGRVKQRKKSGNNFSMLGQGGEQTAACNWMLAGEVVRSGQIRGIFCSKELTGSPKRLKMSGEYSTIARDHSQVYGTTAE